SGDWSSDVCSSDLGNHNRAGLGHPMFDPLAPIRIALPDEGIAKGRGGRKVAVEGVGDADHVATSPGAEHATEFALHCRAVLDRALKEITLGGFGQPIEEAQLLEVGFKLTDQLVARQNVIAEHAF